MAFGRVYRHHAERLALDFSVFAPQFPLLMLVDKPVDVVARPGLHISQYRPEGALRRYHDKRLLIEAGLNAGHSTVVVIDANSRLVEPLPTQLDLRPGLNAFITQPLLTHLQEEEQAAGSGRRRFSTRHQRRCLERAAKELGVSMDKATFVQESIYALHAPERQVRDFIDVWGRLGRFMDYHGLAWSEGFAISLAAATVGMEVHQNRFLPMTCFYKHRLHGAPLARGQLDAPRVFHAQEDMRLMARYAQGSPWSSRVHRLQFNAAMAMRWLFCRVCGQPRLSQSCQ